MKKINFALIGMLFSLVIGSARADEAPATPAAPVYQEGVHYTKLDKAPSADKEVVEIFSFLCPACYSYESQLELPQTLTEELAKRDVKFSQYSLAAFGQMGPELTMAWAIANSTGLKDKVTRPIFEAIHKDRTLRSEDDIKKIFAKFDVSADKYEKLKSDFLVRAFISKQDATIKELGAPYLPVFYINGQYRIESSQLTGKTKEEFSKNFLALVDYLLALK